MVVSAKDITPEERKRLNGHIEAVYQKGSLPPRKFVDQVIQVIEEEKQRNQGELTWEITFYTLKTIPIT